MNSQEYYALKEFYRNYYNGNHFREVYYLMMPTVKSKKWTSIPLEYKQNDKVRPYEKFYKYLMHHRSSNVSLIAALTHYPNYLTWNGKQEEDRLTDRLFFDFDIEPKPAEAKMTAKNLEDTYSNVTGKERLHKIAYYRREYRKLILEEDLILPAYEEVMRFIRVLEDDLKLHPYLTWSGSSGFHVNIFMPDQKLTYINYVRKKMHNVFKNKLNLKCQDPQVLDAISRKQRVPYSINPKTNLIVMPIPCDISYDDLMKLLSGHDKKLQRYKSKNLSMHDFNIKIDDFNIEEYYANTDFIDMLHHLDNEGKAAAIKEREMMARKINVPKVNGNKIYKGMINISKPEDVMRLLSFQCFRNMEWSDYNNLLLVNLLWNTNLSTAADVQKAMIIYWKSKGIELKASPQGLKRVEANKNGKYAPTNNTMKRNDYCMGCTDWRKCFRYKLILSDEYKERIHAYKEKHT